MCNDMMCIIRHAWRHVIHARYICCTCVILLLPSHLYAQEPQDGSTAHWSEYPHMHSPYYPKVSEFSPLASYIVADQYSKQILASYRPSQPHGLASLTKLMVAYITMQKLMRGEISLSDTYVVSDDAIFDGLGNGVSKMGLALHDTVRIEDLLKGLLIASGNDAALMLAYILFGSEQNFVQEMNDHARLLGLHATVFADVTGLSPHNVSTAYDILQLSYIVLTFEGFDITDITNQTQFTWKKTKLSTNLLLPTFEEVDGLKTGYIEETGFNFVASAEKIVRNNMSRRLIVIVLGVVADTIVEGIRERARIAEELLWYGFDDFEIIDIAYTPQEVRIWGGTHDTLWLESSEYHDILPRDWIPLLYSDVQLEENIWAPLTEHSVCGTVSIYVQIGEKDILYLDHDIGQDSIKNQRTHDDLFITKLEMTPTQYVDKAHVFSRMLDYLWVFVLNIVD